jgi:catechol 2,3-dioxygenase-like lactoylglutathione lyase family enzyme
MRPARTHRSVHQVDSADDLPSRHDGSRHDAHPVQRLPPRYRRLDLPGLADLEGRGVYYAASQLEAKVVSGRNAVVVGGANSAGQAALFLARAVHSLTSPALRRPERPPRCGNRLGAIIWRMDHMSHVRRFDHVGITVADLDAVTAFFVALGLEVENRMFVDGEFLDTVIGIPNSRTEIVMLQPPDGGTRLELSSFVRPDHLPGSPAAPANELGLRNVAFEVKDLQAAIDRVAKDGFGLVGGIGEYEGFWKMAYVRGPEGIIVSLAERIG